MNKGYGRPRGEKHKLRDSRGRQIFVKSLSDALYPKWNYEDLIEVSVKFQAAKVTEY
jgi:hypothetical protein